MTERPSGGLIIGVASEGRGAIILSTRIASLEAAVKEQAEQLTRATKQLELAYQKVQEIAEKAIEGSSQSKTLAERG